MEWGPGLKGKEGGGEFWLSPTGTRVLGMLGRGGLAWQKPCLDALRGLLH